MNTINIDDKRVDRSLAAGPVPQHPMTERQQRIHRWIEMRSCNDLTMAERRRLCGSTDDQPMIDWLDERGVDWHWRMPRNRFAGIVINAGQVALVAGGWWWAEGFTDIFAPLRVADETIRRGDLS